MGFTSNSPCLAPIGLLEVTAQSRERFALGVERWALTRTLRIWQLHTELEPMRAAVDSFEPARKLWAEVKAVLASLKNR
tara:strand:+ start:2783 stop:3019 length:237 start_codon:yes stop_codon:yes gene_type:complete